MSRSDAVETLCEFSGQLAFGGLLSLDEETAHILSQSSGDHLSLDGLLQLEPLVSKALSQFGGQSIHLNGLKWILPETAMHLVQFEGESIHLNGLVELGQSEAHALLGFEGKQLHLNGLCELGDGFSRALKQLGEELELETLALNGLVKLNREEATVLGALPLRLELDGLRSITLPVLEQLFAGRANAPQRIDTGELRCVYGTFEAWPTEKGVSSKCFYSIGNTGSRSWEHRMWVSVGRERWKG